MLFTAALGIRPAAAARAGFVFADFSAEFLIGGAGFPLGGHVEDFA